MSFGTVQADVIQSSVANTSLGAGNSSIMKNRLINSGMVIDQRYSGGAISASTLGAGAYTIDRWVYGASQSNNFSAQQNQGSVTTPAGFVNYLGLTVASSYSIGSSDYFNIAQRIEGFNVADLGWGTSNAKTVTLSFWVYSSLTGTFGGALRNSAHNRSYPFTYSIPVANTWTQISITIAGDTSGTWLTTNGVGIELDFGLGVGSTYSGTAGSWAGSNYLSATGAVSVVGTSGATFYLTGVQLEVGSSATGFEYRQYGQELALCQRYFYATNALLNNNSPFFYGEFYSSSLALGTLRMPVTMRAVPSATTLGTFSIAQGSSAVTTSSVSINQASQDAIIFQCTVSGAPTGVCRWGSNSSNSTGFLISAEL